jgi:hypothetical protein
LEKSFSPAPPFQKLLIKGDWWFGLALLRRLVLGDAVFNVQQSYSAAGRFHREAISSTIVDLSRQRRI